MQKTTGTDKISEFLILLFINVNNPLKYFFVERGSLHVTFKCVYIRESSLTKRQDRLMSS